MSSVLTSTVWLGVAGASPLAAWFLSGVQDEYGDRARSSAIAGLVFAPLLARIAPALVMATISEQFLDPMPPAPVNATTNNTADGPLDDIVVHGGPVIESVRAVFAALGMLACCSVVLIYTGGVVVGSQPRVSKLKKNAFTAITSTTAAKVFASACGWSAADLVLVRLPAIWDVASADAGSLVSDALITTALGANLDFFAALGLLAGVWVALASSPFGKKSRKSRRESGTRSADKSKKGKSVPASPSPSAQSAADDWLADTTVGRKGKGNAANKRAKRRAAQAAPAVASPKASEEDPAAKEEKKARKSKAKKFDFTMLLPWLLPLVLGLIPGLARALFSETDLMVFAVRAIATVGLSGLCWQRFSERQQR